MLHHCKGVFPNRKCISVHLLKTEQGVCTHNYFYHSLSIEPAEIKFVTLSYNVKLLTTHLVAKRFIRV